MKKLFIIGGTMGVGKTAVCNNLKHRLDNSVFLDGDWCWDSDPFHVNTETKEMVIKNICFMLNSFLACRCYDNVIFCWVMHEQSIIDDILSRLDMSLCESVVISLICNEYTLKERLEKDIKAGVRQGDIIGKSLSRLELYDELNTIKIITDAKTIEEISREIITLAR